MNVWIIHEIESDRYSEQVVFHGVATTEEERDRIAASNPQATVTQVEADYNLTEMGASTFHQEPSY